MIYVALGIVIATFALIIKNFETRMVLAGSGILMAVLGGDVGYAVTQFVKAMTGGVVPTICTVLGFSYVMQYTKCSDHLVIFLTNCLKKLPFVIIPATVIVTWLLSIALPSAAGIAAAVGALLIPTLLKMGVKPAMAASAVYLGTWGNVISPGMALNPMLADIAQVDVMTVIARIVPSSFMGLAAATIVLTLLAYFMKEGVDFSKAKMTDDSGEQLRVNYLYALIPIIPLVILVLGSKQVALIPYIDVPTSMLIGSVLGIAVTRINVAEAIKKFFKGTGDGYCEVIGLMCAAAVFCGGMKVIGLTDYLVEVMKNSQALAQLTAATGPFFMAMVSGSGNAASLAFYGSVVPHAPDMGYGIIELGSVAQIAAGLGRTMSPVAAATIICAKFAGVSPMDIAKRNALPTLAALVVITLMLL